MRHHFDLHYGGRWHIDHEGVDRDDHVFVADQARQLAFGLARDVMAEMIIDGVLDLSGFVEIRRDGQRVERIGFVEAVRVLMPGDDAGRAGLSS